FPIISSDRKTNSSKPPGQRFRLPVVFRFFSIGRSELRNWLGDGFDSWVFRSFFGLGGTILRDLFLRIPKLLQVFDHGPETRFLADRRQVPIRFQLDQVPEAMPDGLVEGFQGMRQVSCPRLLVLARKRVQGFPGSEGRNTQAVTAGHAIPLEVMLWGKLTHLLGHGGGFRMPSVFGEHDSPNDPLFRSLLGRLFPDGFQVHRRPLLYLTSRQPAPLPLEKILTARLPLEFVSGI